MSLAVAVRQYAAVVIIVETILVMAQLVPFAIGGGGGDVC
jgi:hypothetical protein